MSGLNTIKKLGEPLSYLVRVCTGGLIIFWTLIAIGIIMERAEEARQLGTYTWVDNAVVFVIFWGTFVCGLYWGARMIIRTAQEYKDAKPHHD